MQRRTTASTGRPSTTRPERPLTVPAVKSAFKIASRIVITDSIETDGVDGTWPGPDQEVPKAVWGGPEMDVPPEVPIGSATAEDPSYNAVPPLR